MNSASNAPSLPKTAPPSGIPEMLPNFSLRARNSFGFEVLAEQAYSITRAEQIRVVMEAIVCVRPHLGKLYTLLRAHCDTFCDIVTSSENV
jgi:hypothetical protein